MHCSQRLPHRGVGDRGIRQSGALAGMGPDVAGVFFRALALSTLLSCVPLSVLWFLDRREREAPLFFLAAFLWGACIATAIVVPFNTAFHDLVDRWIALNPIVAEILGPDATILIAAPLAAPITEEVAKAAGVVLIFWLLHDEFDNMRDGFVYGALIGVGFNWFEAALYVARGLCRTRPTFVWASADSLCPVRSRWPCHVHLPLLCFSALPFRQRASGSACSLLSSG